MARRPKAIVTGQSALFGPDPTPPPPPLSADQRRTQKRYADIANGRHPLTRLPLLGTGDQVCGTCQRFLVTGNGYFKCDTYVTNGPATDIRKSWPACTLWEPKEEK